MLRVVKRWVLSLQLPNHILSRVEKALLLFGGRVISLLGHPFPVRRFIKANSVPFTPQSECVLLTSGKLEILFVSTRKDFRTLRIAVESATEASFIFPRIETKIVVPAQDVEECKKLFTSSDLDVEVIDESTILENHIRNRIITHFAGRSGWVLQQLLKVVYVRDSSSQYVLVVDADTLLIHKRQWIDKDGIQLLFPSWEYHRPYYEFLFKRGLGALNPDYTFITHHMLMQPRYFREALNFVGFISATAIIEALTSTPFDPANYSPFCIEYELYGQYMYKYAREAIRLERWGNTSVRYELIMPTAERKNFELEKYKSFASISTHTYLSGD